MTTKDATDRDAVREFIANTARKDPAECACGGSGWTLSQFDTWETCPAHPAGSKGPDPLA